MTDPKSLGRLCIDTIRTLAIDAVQKAQSGHPGTPGRRPDGKPTAWRLPKNSFAPSVDRSYETAPLVLQKERRTVCNWE